MLRSKYVVLIVLLAAGIASAQIGVATGTPPFASFGGGPFDTVNLGNLNVHFAIPVLHKSGRGMPFTYDLSYDSSIWTSGTSSGVVQWLPALNWGWRGVTEVATGYVSYKSSTIILCPADPPTGPTLGISYSNWVYHDPFGTSHAFPGTAHTGANSATCSKLAVGMNAMATDGSGYTLQSTTTSPNIPIMNSPGGKVAVPPYNRTGGSATATDANGNQININSSGQFFDTLSSTTPVLTVSSAAPPTATTFTYTAPSGAGAAFTMNYLQYTVKTGFGVTGVSEYGPLTNSLVSTITLPDGKSYTFTYEQTPGTCTPNTGTQPTCVTGRIAEVTLPTGGTITYAYTGGSHGIESDGSTSGLNRTLSPGGEWQYARSVSGSTWTTTVTDPNLNQTIINFAKDGNTTNPSSNFYETQRQVKQLISGTQTLLATFIKCYNTVYANCATAAVSSPITQTDVYSQLPNNSTRLSEVVYNSYGLVKDDKEYGYGVNTGAAPNTKLIRETAISYASLGNGIVNKPSSVIVSDWTGGTAATLASTTYAYDGTAVTGTIGTPQHISISGSRGNLTTLTMATSRATNLSKTFTYYDTGTPYVVTDVNLAQATYVYSSAANPYNPSLTASCGNSFATTINEPLSLSRSVQWNCIGGVAQQVTDENGQIVKTDYTDPDFWRPADVYDQESNETTISYIGETAVEAALQNFNSGNSASDSRTTIDGFGRTIFSQRKQGPSATNYDTGEIDYNNLGQPSRSTMPYSAAASPPSSNTTAPAMNTTYDALGRVLTTTDADGGEVAYTYTNNDVLQVVSGTQIFQKQFEYDGLGRLTSVCEVTAGTTAWPGGTCNQTHQLTGYWMTYQYDALGRLLKVTQNAQATAANQQTRGFTYDWLGRMTSESNPETTNTGTNGTKTYVYDATSNLCGNGQSGTNGDLVSTKDAAGNCAVYFYDGLHRLTDVGAGTTGGTSACKRFRYDSTHGVNGTIPSGITALETLGRVAEAETDNCVVTNGKLTPITDEWFSYSPRGETTDVYELTPHSGSGVYYHTTASYWPTGTLETLSGIPGVPTINYGAAGAGLDGEGRITQVTAASGTNPVTGVTYSTSSTTNPLGALTGVTFGSADSDSFTYDPNTGRMTGYTFSVNGQTDVGALSWNTNGTLSQLKITDQITGTSDSQTCNYMYDDLQRLSTANCGTPWSQTFIYDPFGNITKSGTLSFIPGYSPTTNQFTTIPGRNVSYDGNGNLLTDNLNSYTWDVFGHMSTVNTGSATVTGTYDALGRMVENNAGGSYTELVYGPTGAKLAKVNGTTLIKAFVALPGGAKAIYNSTGLAYYRHSDWLVSSRLSSTATKPTSMYSSSAYAPFGEQYSTAGTADASFTGQDQDTAPSLYDFEFRRQSPSQGRWISPDPAGRSAVSLANPQSWNRYAYVNNNPLALIDPLGLEDGCTWDDSTNTLRCEAPPCDADASCDGGGGGGGGGGPSGGGGGGGGGASGNNGNNTNTQNSNINPCTGIFGGINNNPGDPGFAEAATETNGETAFPLPGGGYLNGALNVAAVGTGDSANVGFVVSQINSMYMAGNTSLTLYFFSGSAGLFQQALASPDLNPAAVASISQVYFVEPGGLTGPNVGGLSAQTFIGTGFIDTLVQATNGGPVQNYPGGQPISINAPHDFQLAWNTPQVQATIPVSTPCLGENESLPVPGDSSDGDEHVLVAWIGDFISASDGGDANETSCYIPDTRQEASGSIRSARQ